MPKLTTLISPDIRDKLRDICQKERRSQSATISWLIDNYYEIRYCVVCAKKNECKDYEKIKKILGDD